MDNENVEINLYLETIHNVCLIANIVEEDR